MRTTKGVFQSWRRGLEVFLWGSMVYGPTVTVPAP